MDTAKPRKRQPSFGRVLLAYLGAAGSMFFVVTLLTNATWKDTLHIVTTPAGQAVCVVFGAIALTCLHVLGWIGSRADD